MQNQEYTKNGDCHILLKPVNILNHWRGKKINVKLCTKVEDKKFLSDMVLYSFDVYNVPEEQLQSKAIV